MVSMETNNGWFLLMAVGKKNNRLLHTNITSGSCHFILNSFHLKVKQILEFDYLTRVWPLYVFSFIHLLPGLNRRRGYCYFLWHLKKDKARGGIILIYAGFLQKKRKGSVSLEKRKKKLAWEFSFPCFFFPPQWETCWTQVSNAF